MKTQKFFLLAALVAATVSSCSKDNDEMTTDESLRAVQFSSGNMASVKTRVSDAIWDAGDKIGVFMFGSNNEGLTLNNILENANNICYKSTNKSETAGFEVATPSETIYYPASGRVKFVAYYPYSSTITDFNYSFGVEDQTSQSAIDVLYAGTATDYDKASNTVALPFAHKLVKLVFKVSNGDVTTALDNLTVKITQQKTAGSLNLTNGNVTASGTAKVISAIKTGSEESKVVYEAIVLPQSDNTEVNLVFNNGVDAPFTANISDTHAQWASGNKYTYTVTLNKTIANITGSIADWTDNPAEVDANDNNLLANVVIDTPDGNAAPRIYYNASAKALQLTKDPTNWGAFFTYGGVIAIATGNDNGSDYDIFTANHIIFNPTNVTISKWSDIPYTSYSDVTHTVEGLQEGKGDPCRLVGYTRGQIKTMLSIGLLPDNKQWRLPTSSENVTFSTTYSNFDKNKKGRTFTSENVFLPAAGYWISYGYTQKGIEGCYWSSTYAYDGYCALSLTEGRVEKEFPLRGSDLGFSVRCVPQ